MHASEQGNVIRLVSVYICVYKKIVIEQTRDLIYLKFVATDFFPKTRRSVEHCTPHADGAGLNELGWSQ